MRPFALVSKDTKVINYMPLLASNFQKRVKQALKHECGSIFNQFIREFERKSYVVVKFIIF